nr:MAG TPA: Receptor recognition protein, Long tail, Helical sandwich, Tail fiber [Caudoviricetes sp.]
MKLSDLTLNMVRSSYDVEVNGEIETILVYNIFGENRNELKERISKGLEQGLKEKELMELIYKETFELATDLELDEDLIESINKGKKELMFIAQDIDEIVSEIVIEAMLEKQNLLANMVSLTLSKKILLEAEKIEILNKQCEKLEEEIQEMKKGD